MKIFIPKEESYELRTAISPEIVKSLQAVDMKSLLKPMQDLDQILMTQFLLNQVQIFTLTHQN